MTEKEFIDDLAKLDFKELYQQAYNHFRVPGVTASMTHVLASKKHRGVIIQYDIVYAQGEHLHNYDKKIKPVTAAQVYFNHILAKEEDAPKIKAIKGIDIQKEAKTTQGNLTVGKLTDVDSIFEGLTVLMQTGKFLHKWIVKPTSFVLGTNEYFLDTLEYHKRGYAGSAVMDQFYAAINTNNFNILKEMTRKNKDFVDPHGYQVHPGVGTHLAY